MREASGTGASLYVQEMLRTIDCIYAAATGELSWDQAIEMIARLGRFDACTLSSVDSADRRPIVLSAHGRAPFAGGAPGILTPNPLLTDSVLRSAPGAVFCDHEITSPELLATSRFWQDWMRPNGFTRWTAVLVGRQGEQVVVLEAYHRESGPYPARSARFLGQLAPHLRRAWRCAQTISQPETSASPVEVGRADHARLNEAGQLRADFGLTRAEARLALALAEGRSPAEAAEQFGRKLTTVRSQLRQVFAKTGTSRQAELVAMLLGRNYRRPVEHGDDGPAPMAIPARTNPVFRLDTV